MGEIVKPFGEWISKNIPLSIGLIIFMFCVFFEISKVKIYPLRWIWKLITLPIRKIEEQRTIDFKNIVAELKTDIDSKLDSLEKRFDKLDDKQKETEERIDLLAAARIKNHVLNFARQCRKGEPHSHEDFANLFEENNAYQELVKKYNWTNDVYKHDFAYIQKVYDECNYHGEFLE